jgi:HEAT repeat protein
MLILRPYQQAAIDAVYAHLRNRDDNPCIVLPTGSGKTPLIATICKDAVGRWNGRVLVVAHVKELLELLNDEDVSVRYEACEALAQSDGGVDYGPDESASEVEITAAVVKWTKWLKRRKSLPKYAKAGVETIRSGFKSADAVERWAAVTAARLQRADIPTDLIGLLQDDDLDVRQEARHALVQLSDGSDFGPSENATKDQQAYAADQWKIWQVRQDLVQRYRNLSRAALISNLESPNLDDRWAAVTLIRRRQVDVSERLIGVLIDPDPDVRQIARLCLVSLADGEDFGPEEDAADVQQAIAVVRWQKWQRRQEYDQQLTSMDLDGVVAAFKSANPLRRWAAVTIARKRSLKVPRALISRLADEEGDVRREAYDALIELSGQTDFGSSASTTPTQQAAAVKKWLNWWNEQDYEKKAQQRLKLSKLLISKGRDDRAKPRLQTIIDDFPETEAAAIARRLLRQ